MMQCSPIWSPILKGNIIAFESIQRRLTKCICGLKDFSYDDRLIKVGALTLEKRCIIADMIVVYKIMQRIANCSAADVGLTFRCTNTRQGHIQHEQMIVQHAFEFHFWYRVPPVWN